MCLRIELAATFVFPYTPKPKADSAKIQMPVRCRALARNAAEICITRFFTERLIERGDIYCLLHFASFGTTRESRTSASLSGNTLAPRKISGLIPVVCFSGRSQTFT